MGREKRTADPEIAWLRLGNVPLSRVGFAEAVDLITGWAHHAPFRLVVTPNVDHVVRLQADAAFREAYESAALSLADGRPVLWAARWLGLPPIEKVSGSDLAPALCERGAREHWRVFFVGGRDEAELAACVARVRELYPGLWAGGYCPPYGFEEDRSETLRLLAAILGFEPDLILMSCGSPKSEIWLARNREQIGHGVGLSVGATLRFLGGLERRAPRWMQRTGLEWLWRLTHDPRRLWKRYLVDDLKFFPLVWRWKRTARR